MTHAKKFQPPQGALFFSFFRVTDEGLCRAVMEKCQYYSYDKNNNYMPFNDIVVNYIQRAMVNIRAAQYNIISDYASSCMVDVANCYNQQVTQVNSWSSAASINSIYNVMKGACRDVALTCAYAVFDGDTTLCPIGDNDTCINSISDMFYNSMLCGEGEVYDLNIGKCYNPNNKVLWNYNGVATGLLTTFTGSQYLKKNEDYVLPVLGDLDGYTRGCNEHSLSWCWRIDDLNLHCLALAHMNSYTAQTSDPDECAGSSVYYKNIDKISVKIPFTDVNKMIERGDMNVFLSVAPNNSTCRGRQYTIYDENACRCYGDAGYLYGYSGNAGYCKTPTETACPAGYSKYNNGSVYSCEKTVITITDIQ